MESQIAEWRAYVARRPAVDDRDVDELEAHLRDQIAELDAAGLVADEAFLVAVKRMGALDALSREFAREHSGRLWKQLVLSGDDDPGRPSGGWPEALGFAAAAAVAGTTRSPKRGGRRSRSSNGSGRPSPGRWATSGVAPPGC